MPADRDDRSDLGLLEPVRAGSEAETTTSDHAWLRALLDAEAGLTRAQARLGLVPREAADAITGLARSAEPDPVGLDPGDLAVRARGAGNPVVPLIAELRARSAPELSRHFHQGATSQDIMDTAAMLVAARTREVILAGLGRVVSALAELAAHHRQTPMAGRTLGQQAVPTTFGLKAASWLIGCVHARDRLAGLRLPVQLGGAAGTMAAFGERAVELLPVYAEEMGLAEPVLPWHTLRFPVAELGSALATVTGALGKIATDVVLLAQTEVGEVAEPPGPGRGGSSAMPHKRNPALATMVRAAALQVPAYVQILMTAQSAALERPAGEWHAEWQPLRECLRLTGGAAETMAELLEGIEIFPERMRANLDLLLGVLAEHGEQPGPGPALALVDRALEHVREVSP
ncbi:3-carboxy-cis,cis-muconate cycloisomerase [Actinomadura sp. HBU206391]|uniref:3-carboxy-cis,cis-muconate cycloisomerase n=1 Tax=Actinomadura sp. HBU206391 TaxID=2731692 RepID=UPI00164F0FD4|nr:3-carboxy-cis,cis-muconate cycloisomerase [Actinomadura sp. HBU206391]MBC6459145.1 3-carboxy-cis,cis-muconate cycloisomerase [Actinomadura sp. HBU206391]